MAAVYPEITLVYGGREYTITPTYRTIQRFEQRLGLARLLTRISSGDPPLSQMADLLEMSLHEAGCGGADAEEIYGLLHSKEHSASLTEAVHGILLALLPTPKEGAQGNPVAQETEKSAISNGPSTTKSPAGTSASSPQSSGE